MISSAEARLGKNMAVLGAITILITMAIGFLGGSRAENPQLATLSDFVDFVNSFTLIVVIMYSLKLFNLDEAPLIKVIGNVAIIGVTVAMITDLSPAFSAIEGTGDGFTVAQVSEITDTVTTGTWIVMPLFVLLVSARFRGDPIPSWGAWGGIGAGSVSYTSDACDCTIWSFSGYGCFLADLDSSRRHRIPSVCLWYE